MDPSGTSRHVFRSMPASLAPDATVSEFRDENHALRDLLGASRLYLLANHATMVLMEKENARLRERVFAKTRKPSKKETTAYARHMTADENMVLLERADWELRMKAVFKEAVTVFKARRKLITDYAKEEARLEKEAERSEKQIVAEAERERKKAIVAEKRLASEAKRAAAIENKAAAKKAKEDAAVARKVVAAAKKVCCFFISKILIH